LELLSVRQLPEQFAPAIRPFSTSFPNQKLEGGALLFGSPTVFRVGIAEPGAPVSDYIARETAAGAAGAQALIGVGAATLSILALVGLVTQTLVLVSVLAVGGSALLTGGALTGKMVSLLYHH
jgi:hypothetical protein